MGSKSAPNQNPNGFSELHSEKSPRISHPPSPRRIGPAPLSTDEHVLSPLTAVHNENHCEHARAQHAAPVGAVVFMRVCRFSVCVVL